MSNVLRKYRRRMMRRSGMLPKVKRGRRVRPTFKVWTGVIKKAVQAFHEKQKSILEKLREEEEAKAEEKDEA